jgi:hypothetical protein
MRAGRIGGMDEREKEKRGGAGAVLIGVILALLPIVYLLSSGPGVWLIKHGYLSETVFKMIYYPLIFLGNKFDWIGNSLNWYASFWAALLLISPFWPGPLPPVAFLAGVG